MGLFTDRAEENVQGKSLQLALCLLVHGVAWVLLYIDPAYMTHVSSISEYAVRGADLMAGRLSNADYIFEYPPLASLFFIIPRLISPSDTVEAYRLGWAMQMALFDVLVVVCTCVWAWRRAQNPVPLAVLQALFLLAADVMIVFERFDLAPAALILAALCIWPRGRGLWSFACLGIGAAIKIFPAVTVPVLAVDYIREKRWKDLAVRLGIFAFFAASPFLAGYALYPHSVKSFYDYHRARGVQIESVAASPYLLNHMIKGDHAPVEFRFGSDEIVGPTTRAVTRFALPLSVLLISAIAWLYSRRPPDDERRLRYVTAAVCAFLISNKVFSAQFIIWLYPLVPLLMQRRMILWSFYFLALWLTHYVYPHGWHLLGNVQDKKIVISLLARNVLVIGILIALLTKAMHERKTG